MTATMDIRRLPRPDAGAGFTLVEVLITLVIAMIGLMGTLAIQQTVLFATQNANDAAVALRLAGQAIEELKVRTTNSSTADQMAPIATGVWTTAEYVDALGHVSPTQTPEFRYTRLQRVTNLGTGLPYNVSVQVGYNLDTSAPKTVQIDMERRKTW